MKNFFRLLLVALPLLALGVAIYQVQGSSKSNEDDQAATYTVKRRTLEDRVVERGTVESQKTVYGKCDVNRSVKITFIVPEGSEVKEGDVVVKFETNKIDDEIKEEEVEVNTAKGKLAEAKEALEIQKNKNATDIDAAKLEYDLAVIDLKTYKEGTHVADKRDFERAVSEAKALLEKATREKENIETLVKKGYRTPQQLKEHQLVEDRYRNQVDRDLAKLHVLNEFTWTRQVTEMAAKERDGLRKWDAAKKTAAAEIRKAEAAIMNAQNGVTLLENQLRQTKEMLEKCTLKAEQAGTVAYANERWYDASRRIREGTEVYSGRNVYYLPDMTRMQVKAKIHESVVDRVKKDQKATIRLDAFSDHKLSGTVKSVAGMASSSWSSVQNYDTIILIDELPEDLETKPGMTAEVDILVDTYDDVLAVPVGAITEHFSQTYVYVKKGGEFERRRVETDRTTHSFVEITEGLKEDDVVALDAYQRGLEDFADTEEEASASGGGAPAASPVGAGA